MRIKNAGFDLTAFTDFYRNRRVRAENAKAPSAASSSGASRSAGTPETGRTDKIEITGYSKEKSAVPAATGKAIRREIAADADPKRLESLKSRIESGTYPTDPDELARILLTDGKR